MRIGGFVPVSLCDFPCRVAAVVFTQGCNFRCPFCHNGHLIEQQASLLLNEEAVLAQIRERSNRLGGVVVSGGEPTLQGDLPQFLHRLQALGLAVKLDTNGSQPDMLQALFADRLVNYVAMDIKAPWDKYDRLAGQACNTILLRRSMRLIAASGLPHEFRTTRVEALLSGEDCGEIARQVPVGSTHKWQRFRAEHSLDKALHPVEATPAHTPAATLPAIRS
ncbi:MAG: anaerobic ribonucleoside-triphosphate reductase activating protein [Kiritimatiellia bacterium]